MYTVRIYNYLYTVTVVYGYTNERYMVMSVIGIRVQVNGYR